MQSPALNFSKFYICNCSDTKKSTYAVSRIRVLQVVSSMFILVRQHKNKHTREGHLGSFYLNVKRNGHKVYIKPTTFKLCLLYTAFKHLPSHHSQTQTFKLLWPRIQVERQGRHTLQFNDIWAVEVDQGCQSTAICTILQQILHQGNAGQLLQQRLLLPVTSLQCEMDTFRQTKALKHMKKQSHTVGFTLLVKKQYSRNSWIFSVFYFLQLFMPCYILNRII